MGGWVEVWGSKTPAGLHSSWTVAWMNEDQFYQWWRERPTPLDHTEHAIERKKKDEHIHLPYKITGPILPSVQNAINLASRTEREKKGGGVDSILWSHHLLIQDSPLSLLSQIMSHCIDVLIMKLRRAQKNSIMIFIVCASVCVCVVWSLRQKDLPMAHTQCMCQNMIPSWSSEDRGRWPQGWAVRMDDVYRKEWRVQRWRE